MKIAKILLSIITILFAVLGLIKVLPFDIANPIKLVMQKKIYEPYTSAGVVFPTTQRIDALILNLYDDNNNQLFTGYTDKVYTYMDNDGKYMVMFNPEITKKSGPYDAEEGCLSLTGTRMAKRWKSIKVRWQNEKFQERLKTFEGWTAQIIQHEIDHCEGTII